MLPEEDNEVQGQNGALQVTAECGRTLVYVAQILSRIATNTPFPERNSHMTVFNKLIAEMGPIVQQWMASLAVFLIVLISSFFSDV